MPTCRLEARCDFCERRHTLAMLVDLADGPDSVISLRDYLAHTRLAPAASWAVVRLCLAPVFCPVVAGSFIQDELERIYLVPIGPPTQSAAVEPGFDPTRTPRP
jgi:hypothetical protein